MISKALATISLFLAATSLMAQDVNPYAPGGLTEGVVYYLPKTQLKIKVTATRTAYTPGDLCQYAERYLRLKGISSKPSVNPVHPSHSHRHTGYHQGLFHQTEG